MPYIRKEERSYINGQIGPALNSCYGSRYSDRRAGKLNYMLTQLVVGWLGAAPNYDNFNEVIGVLECMKLELYRRMIAPYEDTKCKENGDVYKKEK